MTPLPYPAAKADDGLTLHAEGPRPKMIREMEPDERPREKALHHGIRSLTDAELMALIFATGIKGVPVTELCRQMLEENDNHLSIIADMSVESLKAQFKGIGTVKAITLLGALELGRRAEADFARRQLEKQIRSAADAVEVIRRQMAKVIRHELSGHDHEEFWAVLISQAARPIRNVKIGRGNLTGTVVDVRGLIRTCLDSRAAAMILFHNHPSGQLTASAQDISLTRKIVEAAKLFDIRVTDHIIVTDSDHYSFFDNGKMPV